MIFAFGCDHYGGGTSRRGSQNAARIAILFPLSCYNGGDRRSQPTKAPQTLLRDRARPDRIFLAACAETHSRLAASKNYALAPGQFAAFAGLKPFQRGGACP